MLREKKQIPYPACLTFMEQERLLHTAFGSSKIKGTFALRVSESQVSPVLSEQVDDLHTGLPRCSMQWGIQPPAVVNTGSLIEQMTTINAECECKTRELLYIKASYMSWRI